MKNKENFKANVIIILFIGMIVLFMVDNLIEERYTNSYEIKNFENLISYENLTNEEINFTKEILYKINPIYFTKQKEIIFAKNISGYCDNCIDYAGVNFGNGRKIIIKYKEDEKYLEDLILHECLHSYFDLEEELEEQIIDDLTYRITGYKNDGDSN